MELWIRSQDKEVLTKCDDIRIETTDTNKICAIRKYFDDNNWVRLGIYKAKERGIEVLDEIQKTMMGRKGVLTTLNKKEEFIPFENQVVIYEMPKE